MAPRKPSKNTSDRQKWQEIFDTLVHMLKTQQSQLDTLVKDRKLIEERIKIQRDRWASDVRLLKGQISQMKVELSVAQIGRLVEVAKSELVVGFKQRESFLYKLKLENAESDLEEFKLWFEYLTDKCSKQSGKSEDKNKESQEGEERIDGDQNFMEKTKEKNRCKILEDEMNKLRRACEKLTSKNSSEVSALLSERDFVWNQLKVLEGNYNCLIQNKKDEVVRANAKIEGLLTTMNQLESENNEKDEAMQQLKLENDEKGETILKLKANVAKLEADGDKNNTEIFRLSKEIELLRNSKANIVTPILSRCSNGASSRSIESRNSRRGRKDLLKQESAGLLQASDFAKKETRSSRRRAVGGSSISETSMLFSSRFKVPKLKGSSPRSSNRKSPRRL